MAEEKKDKKKIYTSPKGVAGFCALTEPSVKFNADGVYSVKQILGGEEAAHMMEMLAEEYRKAEEEGRAKWEALTPQVKKKHPFEMNDYYEEEVDQSGNPTGNYIFNYKMRASGISKKTGKPWERRPALFDAAGKPIDPKGQKIYGGTLLKVSFTVNPYFVAATGCGISLGLEAAQILKRGEYGGRNAASYGFGVEEEYAGQPDASEDSAEASFGDGGGSDGDF